MLVPLNVLKLLIVYGFTSRTLLGSDIYTSNKSEVTDVSSEGIPRDRVEKYVLLLTKAFFRYLNVSSFKCR